MVSVFSPSLSSQIFYHLFIYLFASTVLCSTLCVRSFRYLHKWQSRTPPLIRGQIHLAFPAFQCSTLPPLQAPPTRITSRSHLPTAYFTAFLPKTGVSTLAFVCPHRGYLSSLLSPLTQARVPPPPWHRIMGYHSHSFVPYNSIPTYLPPQIPREVSPPCLLQQCLHHPCPFFYLRNH